MRTWLNYGATNSFFFIGKHKINRYIFGQSMEGSFKHN